MIHRHVGDSPAAARAGIRHVSCTTAVCEGGWPAEVRPGRSKSERRPSGQPKSAPISERHDSGLIISHISHSQLGKSVGHLSLASAPIHARTTP